MYSSREVSLLSIPIPGYNLRDPCPTDPVGKEIAVRATPALSKGFLQNRNEARGSPIGIGEKIGKNRIKGRS